VLSPTPVGEYLGKAVVQELFDIGGLGMVAGCKCTDGVIKRGGKVRVMRGDKNLCKFTEIKTLRNLKEEVQQIDKGVECGIGIGFEQFKVGDYIECYGEL
tara:strand:- start:989 stop:1288 length:300 start_codon:yes stop_codon:yes gene_type:complete